MTTDQEKKLDELHAAIVGNNLGQKGIIKRLDEVESYQEKDKAFKYKVAGGLAVGTPVLIAAWHWLKAKLFGEI